MSDVSGVSNTGGQGQAPAGWYTLEDQQRYWDGVQWTDHVAPLPGQHDQKQQQTNQQEFGHEQTGQLTAQPGGQQPFAQPGGQQPFGQQEAAQQQPFGQQEAAQQQPFGQQPFAQPGGQPTPSASDDASMATLAHLGGIIGFLPSLIIWLIKKDQSQFVAHHALKALNFQVITFAAMVGISVIGTINVFVGIPFLGRLLILILFFGNMALCIIGGLAANKGDDHTYPVDVQIVK